MRQDGWSAELQSVSYVTVDFRDNGPIIQLAFSDLTL
jgi:hypothetical protein